MAAGLGILVVLLYGFVIIASIVGLVCFALVVAQMFKHDQTGLGVACIILAFCTGVGPLIAFVFGWTKAKEWDLKQIMTIWSVALALQVFLVFGAILMLFGAAAFSANELHERDAFDDIEFSIDEDDMNFDFEELESEFSGRIELEPEPDSIPPSPN